MVVSTILVRSVFPFSWRWIDIFLVDCLAIYVGCFYHLLDLISIELLLGCLFGFFFNHLCYLKKNLTICAVGLIVLSLAYCIIGLLYCSRKVLSFGLIDCLIGIYNQLMLIVVCVRCVTYLFVNNHLFCMSWIALRFFSLVALYIFVVACVIVKPLVVLNCFNICVSWSLCRIGQAFVLMDNLKIWHFLFFKYCLPFVLFLVALPFVLFGNHIRSANHFCCCWIILPFFSIGLSLSFVLLKDYFIVCIVKGLSYHLCSYCIILPFVLLLDYLAIFVAATKSYYLCCLVILLHVFVVFQFNMIRLSILCWWIIFLCVLLKGCLTIIVAEGLSYHMYC